MAEGKKSQEAELLERYVAQGDVRAFHELADLAWDPGIRKARALVSDEHLAQDAVQEALLALSRQAGTVHPAAFWGWWTTVVKRKVTDLLRARKPHTAYSDPENDDGARTDDQAERGAVIAEVAAVVAQLEPSEAATVRDIFEQDKSARQLAREQETSRRKAAERIEGTKDLVMLIRCGVDPAVAAIYAFKYDGDRPSTTRTVHSIDPETGEPRYSFADPLPPERKRPPLSA